MSQMLKALIKSPSNQTAYRVVGTEGGKNDEEIQIAMGPSQAPPPPHQQHHPHQQPPQSRTSRLWNGNRLPWAIALFFAALSLCQSIDERRAGTYETGWQTEFAPARQSIQVETLRFDGGAAFSPDQGDFGFAEPPAVDYVGAPNDRIDRNWDELLFGRYVLLTEAEARHAFRGEDYDLEQLWSPRQGGYYVGFSMFHTLHCLDRVRRSFYPEYYGLSNSTENLIHRDHCIEHIRQYIQCSGDMTPVPTVYNEKRHTNYVDSNLKHTCRAFQPLRGWLTERYNGTTAVQPKCKKGTYEAYGKLMCNDDSD